MRLKGALRAAVDVIRPSLKVREALAVRRYYPKNGAHDAQNRPHEAIYVQPVIDRQLFRDFMNEGHSNKPESFCLKFRESNQPLHYDGESLAPYEGAQILPDNAGDAVCRNLSVESREELIQAWDDGLPFEEFMDLAAKLGTIDEKASASVFEKLNGAQRLSHLLGRLPQPEIIGSGSQPA